MGAYLVWWGGSIPMDVLPSTVISTSGKKFVCSLSRCNLFTPPPCFVFIPSLFLYVREGLLSLPNVLCHFPMPQALNLTYLVESLRSADAVSLGSILSRGQSPVYHFILPMGHLLVPAFIVPLPCHSLRAAHALGCSPRPLLAHGCS